MDLIEKFLKCLVQVVALPAFAAAEVMPLQFTNYTYVNGLGGGGSNLYTYSVAAANGYLYAGTNNGVSISSNGGATWSNNPISQGLYGVGNVWDVHHNGTYLYAAHNSGLSISNNNGNTWFTYSTQTTGYPGSNSVRSISTSGSYLYLATAGGGVKISTQNGASFLTRTTAHGLGHNEVNSVFSHGSYVYAATDRGVSVSSNNGTSWINYTTEDGLGSDQIWDVFYNNGFLYAATSSGISVSSNNGATWLSYNSFNTNGGLPAGEPFALYAFDNYLLAGYYGGTWNGVTNTWITGGIAISEDNGVSWITYTADNGLGVPSGMYDNAVNDIFIADGSLIIANNRAIAISAFTAVPEPSTYGLILGGLALVGVVIRRRRNK